MKINYLVISYVFNFFAETTLRSLSQIENFKVYVIHVGKTEEYSKNFISDNVVKNYYIEEKQDHWQIIERVLSKEFPEILNCDILVFIDHDIWFKIDDFKDYMSEIVSAYYKNKKTVLFSPKRKGYLYFDLAPFLTVPLFAVNVKAEHIIENKLESWKPIWGEFNSINFIDTGWKNAFNLEKENSFLNYRFNAKENLSDLEFHFSSHWHADVVCGGADHGTLLWGREQYYNLLSCGKFVPTEEDFFYIIDYRCFCKWYNEQIEKRKLFYLLSNHTWILQFLIDRGDYRSYLEIGVYEKINFNKIICHHKVGVDPKFECDFKMTSDNFFDQNEEKFDLIFIDGDHHKETVIRDIQNSIECLSPDGCIVLHDTHPYNEVMQKVPGTTGEWIDGIWKQKEGEEWTGDAWKAIAFFRNYSNLDIATLDFDYGITIIKKRDNSNPLEEDIRIEDLDWNYFESNKEKILNIKPTKELVNWL